MSSSAAAGSVKLAESTLKCEVNTEQNNQK